MKYIIQDESELPNFIQNLKKEFSHSKIFLLKGDLGAGKTTFVKYFIQSLDPNLEVQSPTFGIANLYHIGDCKILHSDLYRLETPEEVLETGVPELLMEVDYAFIEWYEPILPWIEDGAIKIAIKIEKNIRIFEVNTFQKD